MNHRDLEELQRKLAQARRFWQDAGKEHQSTHASTFSIRDAVESRNPRSISVIRASYSPARSNRRFSVKGSAPFARRRVRLVLSDIPGSWRHRKAKKL